MSNRIVIKKTKQFYDIFHGEIGWGKGHWTRFVLVNKEYLKQVAGVRMNSRDYQEVCDSLGIF